MSLPNQQRKFLARRLTLAVAIPIALLIVLGIVLGRQLLQMSEDAHWVDHTDEVIGTAQETVLWIVDQETGLRGYLLTDERSFLEPFEQARPLDGFAALDALVADNPAQQGRFREARRRYEMWLSSINPVLEERDLSAFKRSDAMRERKARMDQVRATMGEAIAVERNLRVQRSADSVASTESTKKFFVGMLALTALLLAVLSRTQLASIAKTFNDALTAEQISRRELEAEAWIRAGYAKVSDAMQGEKSVLQIGNASLAALVEHAAADVGALFVRDRGGWRRSAAIALDARTAGPESFAEGEGVIGRAARESRRIELREDEAAGALKVRSGTGERAPAHVVVFPARVDGVTQAVVELAFMRGAEERSLALIDRVGEVIALGVRSAEHKERLRDLLEETQRQAEELQTQQEEMRVQNEELEQQSRVLQQSQARLENQQAELEQINSSLEEQTQSLERQRDALASAQSELRRANEYKSEFLANMSHELRTPLNSSLILAKLLSDNRDGNMSAEQVKFASTIYSAGNDLLTLINDILDLSKIEAGKLDVRADAVSLARLVDDLRGTFMPVAQDKQLELSLRIDPGAPPAIHSDPTRLSQILKNLLSNALKFTERGGVELTIERAAGGKVAFAVRDTGIGIAADQHAVIFEAFRQADGTTNRKYGGTGLGLSISRDLARLLGGELTMQSEPGRGSTFTLTLPERYRASEFPPAPALAAPRALAPMPSRAPRTAAQAPLPAAALSDDRERIVPGSRSLLIVEDDLKFASVLLDLARELQFLVLVAATAEDGLALAERYHPSAIVLDVGLPDRSGLSVLETLKRNGSTRHVPVHVVSALDYTRTALEMGAAGYAIKPVPREQLIDALKRLESKLTQQLRRVLVVEDDAVQRESICLLIGGDDIATVAVGTASEALEQLRASTFDCLVLDLSLPDSTGLSLLEQMAGEEQYGFPPVIVYTGRSLSRDEEQQLRQFSSSIIIKGARSPERLLDEVTLFLHQVESALPIERQRMLREARHRDTVFEGRRILVVEDDVRNIFALTAVLEPKGAKVEIARNGREALEHLAKKPGVDLVLMDIMMPEMDGLEAMREIRKKPELAKLPIIALTAKAMADDREACLTAGANDYISKPLDVDKLLSLTRVWLPK